MSKVAAKRETAKKAVRSKRSAKKTAELPDTPIPYAPSEAAPDVLVEMKKILGITESEPAEVLDHARLVHRCSEKYFALTDSTMRKRSANGIDFLSAEQTDIERLALRIENVHAAGRDPSSASLGELLLLFGKGEAPEYFAANSLRAIADQLYMAWSALDNNVSPNVIIEVLGDIENRARASCEIAYRFEKAREARQKGVA